MTFLNNKYTKTSKPKPYCYTEKHHIIPKCKAFCGKNDKNNMVHLTIANKKEHQNV